MNEEQKLRHEAAELLDKLILVSFASSRNWKPGEFVMSLSKEKRDQLAYLCSDELRKRRLAYY
jgi:hypothetical protein